MAIQTISVLVCLGAHVERLPAIGNERGGPSVSEADDTFTRAPLLGGACSQRSEQHVG